MLLSEITKTTPISLPKHSHTRDLTQKRRQRIHTIASMFFGFVRRTLLSYAATSSSSPSSSVAASKFFSTSSPAFVRTPRTKSVLDEEVTPDDLEEMLDEVEDVEDMPTASHLLLQEKRIIRQYLRLIELEIPKLVGV